MVFVVGEAGIGKSRLAAGVAADAARRGLPVLRGRAVPTSTPVPYRPLAEALCSTVRGGIAAGEDLGPYRRTLGRLVPEWQTESPLPVDDSVVALAEAVLRFLRVAGGSRGCVVVLEDLHWSDPDTVRVAEYLADNVLSERALCVVTLRDEQPSPALRVAHDLGARRVSSILRLSRLGTDEVAEMVGSCLSAAAIEGDVLAFAGRAGGVPFLVEEVLAAGVGCGALVPDGETWTMVDTAGAVVPDTFADDMRRRLAELGNDGRAVVVAAAVLGRQFEWSLLPAITGRGEAQVLAALRGAVDAQILTIAMRPSRRSGSATRCRAMRCSTTCFHLRWRCSPAEPWLRWRRRTRSSTTSGVSWRLRSLRPRATGGAPHACGSTPGAVPSLRAPSPAPRRRSSAPARTPMREPPRRWMTALWRCCRLRGSGTGLAEDRRAPRGEPVGEDRCASRSEVVAFAARTLRTADDA